MSLSPVHHPKPFLLIFVQLSVFCQPYNLVLFIYLYYIYTMYVYIVCSWSSAVSENCRNLWAVEAWCLQIVSHTLQRMLFSYVLFLVEFDDFFSHQKKSRLPCVVVLEPCWDWSDLVRSRSILAQVFVDTLEGCLVHLANHNTIEQRIIFFGVLKWSCIVYGYMQCGKTGFNLAAACYLGNMSMSYLNEWLHNCLHDVAHHGFSLSFGI